jgi:U3 small nucleolar ribonucleoprotein component
MGHPVCTPNSLESDIGFLLYSGTAETLLWNEVVICLAHQLKDIVQGVFYLDDKEDDGDTLTEQRRVLAYQEAKQARFQVRNWRWLRSRFVEM